MMYIRITSCGDCPLIARHPRGWSEGKCQHPNAPLGENNTKTLLNQASWCPLKDEETTLTSVRRVGRPVPVVTSHLEPLPERRSSWERIMADEAV